LASGEFFKEGSGGQKLSDAIEGGTDTFPGQEWEKPWKNPETVKNDKKNEREGPFGPTYASGEDPAAEERGSTTTPSRDRTLAKRFDLGANTQGRLDPNVVMDAYIIALIEVYSDNLFELLDHHFAIFRCLSPDHSGSTRWSSSTTLQIFYAHCGGYLGGPWNSYFGSL